MHRFLKILLIVCIAIGLLTSATTKMDFNQNLYCNNSQVMEHDTAGFLQYIKTDSFNLSIIAPSSGVQFYKDGIVFLSNTKNEVKMIPEHISFGTFEAYNAIIQDSALGIHQIFSPSFPFAYPCEALTFSSDFKTMYYTKINKKDKKSKLYKANFISEGSNISGWLSEKLPMDICTDNSTYTHPALSADEKDMIFASDREGSAGGMDLFITKWDGEKWSNPQNLGNFINTPANECYPFLDSDNNLFYSSDGLSGYGGYDIFTCKYNGVGWENPINLSEHINSESDDIAFTLNRTDEKTGFYTRRQRNGKSEMQLFRVAINEGLNDSIDYSISDIYNGESITRASTEVAELDPEILTEKPETDITESPPVLVDSIPEESVVKSVTATEAPEDKSVIIEPAKEEPVEYKDIVTYRVQIMSSVSPLNQDQITIDGKEYTTYEYYYQKAYRLTIGEFRTLDPAKELQNFCRKSGYPQAFVAAFRNNIRTLDLQLFR